MTAGLPADGEDRTYPPDAYRLSEDETRGPVVQRSMTVYPPAAELVFAALWRICPDSVRWFQIVMAVTVLIIGLIFVMRAVAEARQALTRCLWLIGAVVLSYTFYIEHKTVIWTAPVEYVLLYALLILPRFVRRKPV